MSLSPEQRQETMKGIIRDLHAGEDFASLKTRFRALLDEVSPTEVSQMEQALIDEGMPESEVKGLCDVHVALMRDSLRPGQPDVPGGHPVHTYMKENRAAEAIMAEIDKILDADGEAVTGASAQGGASFADLVDNLSVINLHYLKKENQLFPLLEANGISGPPKVMWSTHDDIRALLKGARHQMGDAPATAAGMTKNAITMINGMIFKEENILFPMALGALSEDDWQRVRYGEEDVGYAWIQPDEGWHAEAHRPADQSGGTRIHLDTGYLMPEQINLMLTHLPFDMSFVDENNIVRYYTETKERIFPRSPGVIGREVQNCHPPKSVHMVNEILERFRSGERDKADFWIEMGGRFLNIRYFAVRDAAGTYKGCLETMQDVTEIRALQGQRRLLEWD
jgi:uncharacterized protein